jgi:hypothetical protein
VAAWVAKRRFDRDATALSDHMRIFEVIPILCNQQTDEAEEGAADKKDSKKVEKAVVKVDPVEKELQKYSIICSNPWEPDVQ